MDKRFWGILAAISVILIGILVINNSNKAGAPTSSSATSLTNHVKGGGGDNAVELVEYGDFQCPACSQYYPIVEQVVAKYNDQITFQFRHFPLFQIHQNAIAASRAAEAASMQDKFWEMYDMLYQNQASWSASNNPQAIFAAYAKEIGLDIEKYNQDYKSKLVNDRVQADLREGNRLKVTGTPTFFIDGKKISSPDASVDAFSKVIDAAIEQKTGQEPAAEDPAQ